MFAKLWARSAKWRRNGGLGRVPDAWFAAKTPNLEGVKQAPHSEQDTGHAMSEQDTGHTMHCRFTPVYRFTNCLLRVVDNGQGAFCTTYGCGPTEPKSLQIFPKRLKVPSSDQSTGQVLHHRMI